jgi:RNA polymerase sigma factor (sigma-70 family)
MPHADQKYIDALVHNNRELLAELYQKCFPVIKTMVVQNSGTEADAADIFQDSLVDLFKRAKTQPFELSFSICSYIRGMCRYKWNDELKKRRGEGVTFIDIDGHNSRHTIGEDSFRLIEEHRLTQARFDLMREKFKDLGESCKELLQLSWTKDRTGKKISMEEIARILNISDHYARKKKSECIVRLMKLMMNDAAFKNLK